MAQANFKPGHKRTESDVTDRQSEKMLVASIHKRRRSQNLHVQDEDKPHRRKNSDVVDSIGDKLSHDDDVATTATEFEDAAGGGERPTTLDMKPTVDSEQNRKQMARKSTASSSEEETDSTSCKPPDVTYNVNSDSR
jgi:hypothetical protein